MFFLIGIIVMVLLFGWWQVASAQTIVPGAPQTPGAQGDPAYETGIYTLNDFLRIAVNIWTILMGVVGSLALAAFVYGGFVWILSAGSQERIAKGRMILTNAVIGLIIVFTSWMIVNFVFSALCDDNSNICTTWSST